MKMTVACVCAVLLSLVGHVLFGGPRGALVERQQPLLVKAEGSPIAVSQGGALAAGDVNGDGFADLVLLSDKALGVHVGGKPRWTATPDHVTGITVGGSEIVLSDVNNDGRLDVAFADHDRNDVSVLIGSGDGRFQPVAGSPFTAFDENIPPHTHGLAAADVNGDGHRDLVIVNNEVGTAALLLGSGAGTFTKAPHSPFACGASPYPIAAADLNDDGCADVAVPNSTHGKNAKALTILLGSRDGQLKAASYSPLPCHQTVWFVAIGDVTGDEQTEIVATHGEGHTGATIFIGSENAGFRPLPQSLLPLTAGAWGVEIGDMDRDGKGDLVFAANEQIHVYFSRTAGPFQAAPGSPFPIGKGGWRLQLADFNGDGKLDVACKSVETNEVTVLSAN